MRASRPGCTVEPNVWCHTLRKSAEVSEIRARISVDLIVCHNQGVQWRTALKSCKSFALGVSPDIRGSWPPNEHRRDAGARVGLNTSVATNSPAYVSNPVDPRADYGRASFDIRHAAVINAKATVSSFARTELRT